MTESYRKLLLIGILSLILSTASFGQAATNISTSRVNSGGTGSAGPVPPNRGWTDPALDHNRLVQNNGTYQLISGFKVKGSQFLFGQQLGGDMFSAAETAYNIILGYNTYNQEVEFFSSSNLSAALVKEPGTLDSFVLHADTSLGLMKPIKFVYSSTLNTKGKAYYQVVHDGQRFNLYKKYKSELGFDQDNYTQTDLRQFDLTYEYYYLDKETKSLKKLKPNAPALIKEFKTIKDVGAVIDEQALGNNTELALEKLFYFLNDIKKAF